MLLLWWQDDMLNPYVVADAAMEVLQQDQGAQPDRFVKQLLKIYRQPLGMQLVLALLNHIRPRGWTTRVANKNGVQETLSLAYARIVLVCSNYERSEPDRVFFETLYNYMEAILKIILPRVQWVSKIQELHELIRSEP